MIRHLVLLAAAMAIASCSDNQHSPNAPVVIAEAAPAQPLAVLIVEQQQIDALTSVALDATQSRNDPEFTSYKFEVRQSGSNRKKLLAGPGQTTDNYATVILPSGTYEVTLTVMDSAGDRASVTETITVEGSEPKSWRPTEVEWSLDPFFRPGDETETYSRSNGPFSLGLVHSLYETSTLGSSGGCGGMLNNAGNGIGIVTGVIGIGVAIAAPELELAEVGVKKTAGATTSAANAAGASTKIAGGNNSGACVQAQIDAINDQLAFQEKQILDLYDIIDRDEELFFKALVDEAEAINELENVQFNDVLAVFSGKLGPFMQAAALWDESNTPWMVSGVWGDGKDTSEELKLDQLKIAASESSDPACTANFSSEESCVFVVDDGGPIAAIGNISLFSYNDLMDVAGLKDIGNCTYDCWQHVGPARAAQATPFLNLYKVYAEQLYAEVILCTSNDTGEREPCRSDQNNVVPLFDQYNTAIAMQYLKAVNALQKSHSIRQLINLYNYHRYVASECSIGNLIAAEDDLTQSCLDIQQETKDGIINPVLINQILAGNSVNGTFYKHNGATICGVGTAGMAETPEHNSLRFKCAQQQLGMLYAQMFSVLYTHALNFTITDGPVGSQAYPATSVVFPPGLPGLAELYAALQAFNLNLGELDIEGDADETPLGARFDYEYEIGRSLPGLMGGARTPIDLLNKVAGIQTASNGSNWTTDGVLYQAYQISDAAVCVQTFLDYNASGQSDVKVEAIYPNYEDCPSIFALHDGTGVVNGFYDGITVQPYSFKVSPGGGSSIAAEPCPAACNSCLTGFDIDDPDSLANWTPGGQGLFGIGDGGEQCRGFCSGSTTNGVPDNTCGDYDFADAGHTDCTQCSEPANVAVLALSAPMGGNVRQCQVAKVAEVAQGAVENDPLSCNGSVYYGKQYLNSLSEGAAPGFGAQASFKQMIDAGEYSLRPSLPALDWNSATGDNGSWSSASPGNYPFCVNPIFSGYAGNPDSPPTLEATCETYYQGTVSQYNKTSCASGRWGLGSIDAKLFCQSTDAKPVFSEPNNCSNIDLGGDPAPGYYKQCFCPEGNQLGWLRPEPTTETVALAPGLTYLSCGNFAEFNPPRVAWEYEYEGGAQKHGDDDDLPPTYFKDHLSESTPTFEEDIGILGSTGSGVNYEVAFANVNADCNTQDNIQLDVVEITTNFTCKSPTAYQDELTTATWTQTQDPTTSQDDFTGHKCLEFKGAEIIRNSNNDKSVFYNMVLTPPNRLGTEQGPGIPIDLVMQCSDNNELYDECDGQSMCMHMVSFKDVVDSSSPIERAEAMAKRGYICEAISNYPEEAFGTAKMHCELADGRTMALELKGWHQAQILSFDARARLTISILD